MTTIKEKFRSLDNEQLQRLTVLLALILLCIFFAFKSPYFLSADNFLLIITQTAVTGITAYGMVFVIISQAVDLSIGSTIAVAGVACAMMISAGIPLPLAILFCILLGAVIGVINGFCVSKMGLPPFVATLGMQMVLRGLALVVTDASPVYVTNSDFFKKIAQGKLFGVIQFPAIYLVVLGIISAFILKKTVIGRHIYAVGSNEDAAKLSGINTAKIRMFAYSYSGIMAAIAVIVLAARVNSGQPTIATGYECNAIAASVIGGASMTGGHGTVSGTILGALVMGILLNGLNLMSVSQNWQTVITVLVVIGAVYMDKLRNAKSRS